MDPPQEKTPQQIVADALAAGQSAQFRRELEATDPATRDQLAAPLSLMARTVSQLPTTATSRREVSNFQTHFSLGCL